MRRLYTGNYDISVKKKRHLSKEGVLENSASWKPRKSSENANGRFILSYKLELKSA